MADYPERAGSPFSELEFSELELRQMWTYGEGGRTVKAFWRPGSTTATWVLVDPATGKAAGEVPAGEFSRRFRPVDAFADVTSFSTYLGTVTAPDGTALVDLVLDRNPFMLANGPGRTARPHTLMLPRRQRDGWSSAPAGERAALLTAMTLVAAWYGSLDGGHVAFAANDSAPNLDYRRDAAAPGAGAGPGTGAAVTKNPRQEVQHAHLHAFYLELEETENHEAPAREGRPAVARGYRAFGAGLGGDAVRVDAGAAEFAARVQAAAQPWGGSYCSYQLDLDGPFWVMAALGPAQAEFNRSLARADGLRAGPAAKLDGAVDLLRPGLGDPARRAAAQRATAGHQAGFAAFAARRGLDLRSLAG
ncbi:MAG TPA: hypothetical protein VGD91_04620 [Trebonia sp.]